jgi:hypothetical protein
LAIRNGLLVLIRLVLINGDVGVISKEIEEAAGVVPMPMCEKSVRDGYVVIFEVFGQVHDPLRNALATILVSPEHVVRCKSTSRRGPSYLASVDENSGASCTNQVCVGSLELHAPGIATKKPHDRFGDPIVDVRKRRETGQLCGKVLLPIIGRVKSLGLGVRTHWK